jgi:hypothetical protein
MCWSFEVSLGASIFCYAIGLFLLFSSKSKPTHRFYGLYTLTVNSMELAEAYLWYNGDLVL